MPRVVKDNDSALRDGSVRLIDADNEQLGIVAFREAVEKAAERGMDLVLVSDQTDPPVCRIMNFGKYRYQKKRQMREQRKKQHTQRNKEIKFHANIDTHDYQIKVNHIREFLAKGTRVKVSLFFRGREMAHREKGMELMNRVVEDVAEVGHVDSSPRMMGRAINMLLAPGTK